MLIDRVFMASALALSVKVCPAQAAVMVAGESYDEVSFVDEIVASTGTYEFVGPEGDPLPASLEDAVVDFSPYTGTYANPTSGAEIRLRFTDNLLWNGPGDDLVFFEISDTNTTENLRISLPGGALEVEVVVSKVDEFPAVLTGGSQNPAASLNRGFLDLSSFGVPTNAFVDELIVNMDTNQPDLGAVIAISVPEPTAGLLFVGALALLRYRFRY